MTICRFRVGTYLELPDHLVILGNLLPFDPAVKELQGLIVRADNQGGVAGVTVGNCPLDGRVESVKELFNAGDDIRGVKSDSQTIISVDFEEGVKRSRESRLT